MAAQPTFVDLYCGAGGLSLGLQAAGFGLSQALDADVAAVNTHNANFDGRARTESIHPTTELTQAPVIVGGPPCQGFSSAGLRRSGDERNSQVAHFAALVARHRPRAFLFENVEGFLTAEGGRRLLELLDPVIAAGYRVRVHKLNAANYGVPQHRKRVVAVGGLGWSPSLPPPTHRAFGAPGAELVGDGLPYAPTVADALAGLPPAADTPPGVPQGHIARRLTGPELERARRLEPGQTMRDLPSALQHDSYQRRANRRVKDGTPTDRRGGAPTGVRRLRSDHPSKAITGGAQGEFLHPTEDRPLTLRECARLQTFPDSFRFVGSPSDQMQLVGNAVPPLLARVLGEHLSRELREAACRPCEGPGRLLSFVPTESVGLSPALQEVVHRVAARFGAPDPCRRRQPSLWD